MSVKTDPACSYQEARANQTDAILLNLNRLSLLLIGGGAEAAKILQGMRVHTPQALLTVVAAAPSGYMLELLSGFPNCTLHNREFDEADLDRHNLVVVATDDELLNQAFGDLCRSRRLLTHIAGHPDKSDFSLPALEQVTHKTDSSSLRMEPKWFRAKQPSLKNTLLLVFAAIALMLTGHLLFSYFPLRTLGGLAWGIMQQVDAEILIYILGGFVAQLIDGALGMAYGVSANTFLLSFGVSPVAASASVHASEIFTSGVSGWMHLKFGNVNSKLFKNIVLPGVLGAILGAYLLFSFEAYLYIIKPIVAVYTLVLGILIIRKVLRKRVKKQPIKRLGFLATAGGFLDAIGGGGWGPIVSSTLIAKGRNPMYTIGSVNLAEFFVSIASSATFIAFAGISHWQVILGLILGGTISAPIGARLARKLPVKTMMLIVGIVVIIVSLRLIFMAVL